MPRGFTEHEKELIHKRLLEQGYKIFSAYGLKKTNVEELARAVGISKGAFYNFYESKEALFMDVIEQVEVQVRQEILALIDQPGATPRARLYAILKKAIHLFETVPILRIFTGGDFDLLLRRISAEQLQEHLASDRVFFDELITRCREAGIPIRAQTEQIAGLMYPIVQVIFHEGDIGWSNIDLLLELVAAYCLGEVEMQLQNPGSPAAE